MIRGKGAKEATGLAARAEASVPLTRDPRLGNLRRCGELLLAALALTACAHPPAKPANGIPLGDYTFLTEKIEWLVRQVESV